MCINEFNIKLQYKNQLIPNIGLIFIKSFKVKLKFLRSHFEKNELTHFSACKNIFE